MRFARGERGETLELSLVPLIDVVLVILIFLSVTTTFSQVGVLGIDLPEAGSARQNPPRTIVVAVDAAGYVFVEGEGIGAADPERIRQALVRLIPAGGEPVVTVEADAATPHQRVIDVLTAAQRAGVARVAFAVQGPPQ
ncbi:MAG: biopolymer transporter ExbD [Hydrogenophilus sp.]|nr:biopolymer transporter ExbD [Hydrogenophilus sp.]